MCLIVVGLRAAPGYSLLVAANRDEQHARPTRAGAWWDDVRVLGGRDLKAGGTWLAVNDRGRFAAVTNIRETEPRPRPRSRGTLVADFLTASDSAADYAQRARLNGADFGAYSLLLYDGAELHFTSNRAPAARLDAGFHAFSNAPAGVAWPKTASALAGTERVLAGSSPLQPLFAVLAERDDSATAELRRERSHFVVSPIYGTRCSTVVLIAATGQVTFAERTFDATGTLVGEMRESFELDRG